jgi:hypothetical protein
MRAGIDVSQFNGAVLWTTRPASGSVVRGRPAADQAHIPPARFTASKSAHRSESVTAADRPPERHMTTI